MRVRSADWISRPSLECEVGKVSTNLRYLESSTSSFLTMSLTAVAFDSPRNDFLSTSALKKEASARERKENSFPRILKASKPDVPRWIW